MNAPREERKGGDEWRIFGDVERRCTPRRVVTSHKGEGGAGHWRRSGCTSWRHNNPIEGDESVMRRAWAVGRGSEVEWKSPPVTQKHNQPLTRAKAERPSPASTIGHRAGVFAVTGKHASSAIQTNLNSAHLRSHPNCSARYSAGVRQGATRTPTRRAAI